MLDSVSVIQNKRNGQDFGSRSESKVKRDVELCQKRLRWLSSPNISSELFAIMLHFLVLCKKLQALYFPTGTDDALHFRSFLGHSKHKTINLTAQKQLRQIVCRLEL